jgi:FMN phosphatase YigB (HAD superfamily)
MLGGLDISDAFNIVMTSDTIKKKKPDPEVYKKNVSRT